ncbi:class I SAM-dependent methyltransferase [Pedobacter sp. KBW06]|uniref:class I SAM-dependent methyltransferase n=1 Tax=Pedobacter sp. KBW06 TaxID=2153359 RepID=UPI000F5B3034|nr:class I SAM-dependent methyltransferase [Pedobacter sp. KBW06]RQO74060.1 class I SAM-dependent methyltransferase [Pedobacter sp. KBW06]
MKKEWTEEELKEVASQLSQPKGKAGIKTGERMALSNENMITRTIESLALSDDEKVLEIGQGNGSHVGLLMDKAKDLLYTGTDISMTMIEEAKRINAALINSGSVSFELSDGEHLDFPADTFQKIFTVNTLYFWKDPKAYAAEIYKVLKPGGRFCIAFAAKEFMEQLPFTKWEFQLYTAQMLSQLLEEVGFHILDIIEEKDHTQSNLGTAVQRDIVIVAAGK